MSESSPVLLFQRIVPSHRVPVFRRLYEKLGIIVCHTDAVIKGNPSFWQAIDYRNVLLPGGFFLGRQHLFTQRVLPVLRELKPSVVICEYAFGNLTFWKLYFFRLLFRYRLIGWTHGVKNRDMLSGRRSLHYRLNTFVTSRLDAVLLYSRRRREMLIQRIKGIEDRVFIAKNTLATTEYTTIYDEYAARDRGSLRAQLGLDDVFTICFMGRLLPAKRIDLLLSAWEQLQQRFDVNLVVIGGGPEEERFNRYRSEKRLHNPGPIHDVRESGKYLAASDVMMIPGAVGLGLIHAFSFHLPLVTCEYSEQGPLHGPEFEYLEHDRNGLVCKSTPESLADAAAYLISNPDILAEMRKNAFLTVRDEASIDNMVEGFREAIDHVLKDND